MKILYLYAEVMGYTMATIRELAQRGNEVHVVHWDHIKLTSYQASAMPNVVMYKRSELSVEQLLKLSNNIAPSLTVVSGWMDRGYMLVSKHLKSRGVPVVVCLDGQWKGTTKQRIAALLGVTGYFSQYYSHAWVAGICQFEYARRLGFEKKKLYTTFYVPIYLYLIKHIKTVLKISSSNIPIGYCLLVDLNQSRDWMCFWMLGNNLVPKKTIGSYI